MYKREMSITHTEFYRLIKKTVLDPNHIIIDPTQSSVRLRLFQGEVRITLVARKALSIGALVLPKTCAQFTFHALTAQQITHYLDKFNLTFQRGGG